MCVHLQLAASRCSAAPFLSTFHRVPFITLIDILRVRCELLNSFKGKFFSARYFYMLPPIVPKRNMKNDISIATFIIWLLAFMSENMLKHKFLMFLLGYSAGVQKSSKMKFYSSVFHLSSVQYLWLIYAELEKRNNPMHNSLCCRWKFKLWFMWKISSTRIWVETAAIHVAVRSLCCKQRTCEWLRFVYKESFMAQFQSQQVAVHNLEFEE